MDPHVVFTDPEKRKILMEKFLGLATPTNIMSDTRAFLDYLAAQHDVKPGGIGTTGYCMGGLMSLTAAGTYPDDIVATASYHGGRLATDAPDSPHLLAPKMKSRVYIAGAIEGGFSKTESCSGSITRPSPRSLTLLLRKIVPSSY